MLPLAYGIVGCTTETVSVARKEGRDATRKDLSRGNTSHLLHQADMLHVQKRTLFVPQNYRYLIFDSEQMRQAAYRTGQDTLEIFHVRMRVLTICLRNTGNVL